MKHGLSISNGETNTALRSPIDKGQLTILEWGADFMSRMLGNIGQLRTSLS
jgi:hypothetical protein